MRIFTAQPICSKCGAKNSETFFRAQSSGMRCLSCGHELIDPPPDAPDKEFTIYKQSKMDGMKF